MHREEKNAVLNNEEDSHFSLLCQNNLKDRDMDKENSSVYFDIQRALILWFNKTKRAFPWREEKISPYGVWVSEIMLQQTRAEVVIPYYLRWMHQFPTIEALSFASKEEVMKAWEGLGYYRRAENLRKAALFLMQEKKGALPAVYEELLQIPGFGPYTAGAVMSFAFHAKIPAVDGNVIRVMTRLFALKEKVESQEVKRQIADKTTMLLPDEEPWMMMEALIEFGALVCKKKPDCMHCPVSSLCIARKEGCQEKLPHKKTPNKSIAIARDVAVVFCKTDVLIRQVPEKEVMGGLYEFLYFNREDGVGIENHLRYMGFSSPCLHANLDSVSHTFTQFRASLYPSFWQCKEKKEIQGFIWVSIDQLAFFPFSSGHRKIARQVEEFFL